MPSGFSIASLTAVLVISLKVTRFSTGNSENRILSRQAMNSPSRSGSVARYTSSTPESVALFRIVAMTLSAPSVHSQGGSGRIPFSQAHIACERFLPPPCGRSWIWPEQASTIHPLPRYFFTVRALAPDSRINNFIVPSFAKTISQRQSTGFVLVCPDGPCINMSSPSSLQRARERVGARSDLSQTASRGFFIPR